MFWYPSFPAYAIIPGLVAKSAPSPSQLKHKRIAMLAC